MGLWGMVGHFRHFIAPFAHLTRPLNNHYEGDTSKLKAHKVILSRKAKEAFNLLKQAPPPGPSPQVSRLLKALHAGNGCIL